MEKQNTLFWKRSPRHLPESVSPFNLIMKKHWNNQPWWGLFSNLKHLMVVIFIFLLCACFWDGVQIILGTAMLMQHLRSTICASDWLLVLNFKPIKISHESKRTRSLTFDPIKSSVEHFTTSCFYPMSCRYSLYEWAVADSWWHWCWVSEGFKEDARSSPLPALVCMTLL